jgi:hypothetical protein
VEVQTNGVNGISNVSNSMNVSTRYVALVLVVTPTNTPHVGDSYQLNLSATYADNVPQADLIAKWYVDWSGGNGPTEHDPSTPGDSVNVSSPSYSDTITSQTATITAVDGDGRSIDTTYTMYFTPPTPTGRRKRGRRKRDSSEAGRSRFAELGRG